MLELVIADDVVPAREVATLLAELFPAAGTYVVKAASGQRLEVALSHPAARAVDPRTLWDALFPIPGAYEVGPWMKAVQVQPGLAFEEWWLELVAEQARTHVGSVRALLRAAIEDFLTWHAGHLHEAAQLEAFERLLFDQRQAIRWSVANPLSPGVEQAVRKLGFTDRDVLDFPGVSYKLGLIDAELRKPGVRFAWPRVLQLAGETPLLHSDEVAIAVARARAGEYLTPVLLRDGTAAHAGMLEHECDLLRTMTADAIRAEVHPREFARQLYQRLGVEEGIQRDFERVARTEIQEARLRGAFEGERRSRNWTPETLVYKTLAANPCSGCLRLWKNGDGTPRLITVRQLEAEDQLGPNRGPWREWRHRIGPSHPNCLDSPALTWQPALAAVFARSAPQYAQMMEQRGLA